MRGDLGNRVSGYAVATGVDASTQLWSSWVGTGNGYNYYTRAAITWTNVSSPGVLGATSLIKLTELDSATTTVSGIVWSFVPQTTFGTAMFDWGDEGFRGSASLSHPAISINSVGTVWAVFTGYQAAHT
jgi:hypothetical protein